MMHIAPTVKEGDMARTIRRRVPTGSRPKTLSALRCTKPATGRAYRRPSPPPPSSSAYLDQRILGPLEGAAGGDQLGQELVRRAGDGGAPLGVVEHQQVSV